MKYWAERWSELRQKEMVDFPEEFFIHDEFTTLCSTDDIMRGFSELYEVLHRIYGDMAQDAEGMLLPLSTCRNMIILRRRPGFHGRLLINMRSFYML